jgi:hypothetical protein
MKRCPLQATKRSVMGWLKLEPSNVEDFVVTLDGNILDEILGISGLSGLVIEHRHATRT